MMDPMAPAATIRELVACDTPHTSAARETCVTVADHILPMMIAEGRLFADDTDEVRTRKQAGLSQELVTSCLEREFTSEEIDCILRATALDQVSACQPRAPAEP